MAGSVGDIGRVRGARMIDLSAVDLEELAMALADQDGYEHRWLIDPDSDQISFWTEDGGLDGQNPIDLDEVDLIGIHPLPSYVWYQDMADFADGVSDEHAGRRLARAIREKGSFRRFKDELHEECPGVATRLVCLPQQPSPASRCGMARRQ
jgi:hypothetical protein